ncbi:MAG: GNAT family N-acetyltransferase [Rubrobacter sp.]|nr:GNAT family N-acetyltransferase [Rubrobacter sp.]
MVREIDQVAVALIRRFNRTVTERVGALEESFLRRDRPLGASRLLWEIGEDGADLHELHGAAPAELKRMWVDPGSRGLGVGRRLLESLEALARENGVRELHLETNRALKEATELYRRAGYKEVAPFNDEPYAHHRFEKALP